MTRPGKAVIFLSMHSTNTAARFADFHISFNIGGHVVSHTVKQTTMNAAYATMDRLVDEAEADAAKGRSRHLAPLCAYNCAIRKIERIDPEIRAQMAIARGDGAARRASGWA